MSNRVHKLLPLSNNVGCFQASIPLWRLGVLIRMPSPDLRTVLSGETHQYRKERHGRQGTYSMEGDLPYSPLSPGLFKAIDRPSRTSKPQRFVCDPVDIFLQCITASSSLPHIGRLTPMSMLRPTSSYTCPLAMDSLDVSTHTQVVFYHRVRCEQ